MASLAELPAMKGFGYSPFHKYGVKTNIKARVGVPGYPLYKQDLTILLHWTGSTFQAVLRSPLFYAHLVLLAVSIATFCSLPFTAAVRAAYVPVGFASSLNSLAIFMLTFFLGQCFSEANARFENVCKTNGNVTRLSALAGGMLPYDSARLLMRYVNSIMHIYYMLLSGPMDDKKWGVLVDRGLLTDNEVRALQLQGSPAVVIYSWCIKALRSMQAEGDEAVRMERTFYELVQPLEEQIGGTRGLAAKQIAYTLYQIPSVYFHIVYVAVNGFLVCTSYEAGWAMAHKLNLPCVEGVEGHECLPAAGMILITEVSLIVLMTGLLLAAEGMSDIYGNKPFHYDLGVDLDALWQESQNVLKSMAVECPCLGPHGLQPPGSKWGRQLSQGSGDEQAEQVPTLLAPGPPARPASKRREI